MDEPYAGICGITEDELLTQKIYIYCLSKATLLGRDITFDQQGKYNLPERVFSGHRVKNFVTVIRVDGELPKEQIREDAKPLEELTFTSALPFLLM